MGPMRWRGVTRALAMAFAVLVAGCSSGNNWFNSVNLSRPPGCAASLARGGGVGRSEVPSGRLSAQYAGVPVLPRRTRQTTGDCRGRDDPPVDAADDRAPIGGRLALSGGENGYQARQ